MEDPLKGSRCENTNSSRLVRGRFSAKWVLPDKHIEMLAHADSAAVARNRYRHAFSSNIFNPPEPSRAVRYVPAGKRRDMNTAELFGNEVGNTEDLRSQPVTFYPREDDRSARQKKLMFLESDVLPHALRAKEDAVPLEPLVSMGAFPASMDGRYESGGRVDPDAAPVLRRHQDLSSNLFSRQTPDGNTDGQDHYAENKITPSDFNWFSAPRDVQKLRDSYAPTMRAYEEKTSGLFNHKGPPAPTKQELMQEHQANQVILDDEKRNREHNQNYSDLFGTPKYSPPREETAGWHPRHCADEESKITINQEWSDAKTELFKGLESREDHERMQPNQRHHAEFDSSRVLNLNAPASMVFRPNKRDLPSFVTDNSAKITRDQSEVGNDGPVPVNIHQQHLKSSLMEKEFYKTAKANREWEVAEIHLMGLPGNADDKYLKELIHSKGGHIVKVNVEMDPVSHICKGRAKIVMRYNPSQYNINEMIGKLERHNLVVLF